MRKIVIVLFLILIPSIIFAQRWKRERWEAYAGVGTNHFLGDLGGGAEDAAHFMGVRDIDWQKTRPTMQFGIRYRILEELTVKPVFSYAFITAADYTSGSMGRYKRNLHFRSHLLELGAQVEYYFIKEQEMARYTFASMRSLNRFNAYVFLGGGGLYFEPKAQHSETGEWHNLRTLNTEGQGQAPYEYTDRDGNTITITPDDPYKPFAAYLSMGLGARYKLNDRISIGLEISNRYTSTDYIDDVSDRYYNYRDFYTVQEMEDAGINPVVLHFSDRHITIDEDGNENPATPYPSGTPRRGSPEYNDAYVFTIITGFYRFRYSVRSLPKF